MNDTLQLASRLSGAVWGHLVWNPERSVGVPAA